VSYFSSELRSQPSLWREAAGQVETLRAKLPADGERLGLIGCGTSLYVAQAAAAYRERQGAGETDAYPASEVVLDRPWAQVVALSRSGTTTEVIDVVRALPDGVRTLAVTGSAQSPLAEIVGDELNLAFADERSVVQTRFATTALSLLLGVYGWDVEASARRAEGYLEETLPAWAGDIEQFVFLGRGVAAAVANEAALKFREILCTWSESYPTMEYRHGPISAIDERSLVWILDGRESSIDTQIAATGARVIRGDGDPLAELVRIHRFAEGLADLRGINPDEPPHLTRSVVLTEDR
jgi:glucosamine--fructose-6-phosphate aminotransferase (isomerizing)